MKKNNIIVGIDAGTTKTCVIAGEIKPVNDHLEIEIVGLGNIPSAGVKKGVVVNIEKTAESIKKAVEEAENTAGIEIKAAYVSITGDRLNNFSSHGVIAVKEHEISQREIGRVIDAAKTVPVPFDREILHVIPTGFTLDGQNGINDPRGMTGARLEAEVQIITVSATSVHNLIKSCRMAGLDVVDIIFEPLISAEALLNEEEKDIGVGVIDIGGGTTKIIIFHEGAMRYCSVLNVGGNNFTNDIAIGLRIPISEAERIKKEYGCTMMSMVNMAEEIEIAYAGDRPNRGLPRQHLIEVIQPRAEELFYLVKEEMLKSNFYGLMTSGIVLTGGASLMHGMDIMAENILELPARIGRHMGIKGYMDAICSPVYATATGLIFYGVKEIIAEQKFGNGNNIFNNIATKMKGWARKFKL